VFLFLVCFFHWTEDGFDTVALRHLEIRKSKSIDNYCIYLLFPYMNRSDLLVNVVKRQALLSGYGYFFFRIPCIRNQQSKKLINDTSFDKGQILFFNQPGFSIDLWNFN
jgi:hypothetical protein